MEIDRCNYLIISKNSVIFILASVLVNGTAGMALIYYLPRYLLNLGNELSVIQFVTTLYPFTFTFLPPFLGKLSDKLQNRYYFILTGSIGISTFFLLLLFSTNIAIITSILIFYAVFASFYRVIFSLYQELIENDPKYVSYYNAVSVFGWFLGSQIGGIFLDLFEISSVLIFILVTSLINIFFVIFIKEERSKILQRNEFLKINDSYENNSNNRVIEKGVSRALYFALFFRHFGVRPIITILAVLMSFHLTSDTQIGFLLGFNPLLQFFLMLITGKIITNKNQKIIIVIGFLLSSVAIFGYMVSTEFFGFLLSQIMVSFSFALFWNAIQIYIAQKTNPLNKGKYLGYAQSSFFSGGFVGGLFLSLLLLFNPNYYAFMWILMFFPLISVCSIILSFKS